MKTTATMMARFPIWCLCGLILVSLSIAWNLISLSDEDIFVAPNTSHQLAIRIHHTDSPVLPKVDVKSIYASPFQAQLIALISLDGIEHRVLVGQKLSQDLTVKAIDAKGVDILFRQQLYRHELALNSKEKMEGANEPQSTKASVEILSSEFHRTPQGLEVYSATQQGLSASLGLQNGDRVNMINGELVDRPEDITRLLKYYHPKHVLEFVGTRQGQIMTWKFQAQSDD